MARPYVLELNAGFLLVLLFTIASELVPFTQADVYLRFACLQ